MRIAYDLRYATDAFPGIGTHAHALAVALLERPELESIDFLWDPNGQNGRFDLGPLKSHARARWHEIAAPAMSPWTAFATGRKLAELESDLYLSPFWLRPEGARMPIVLTLHDVLPLARPELMRAPRRWLYRWAMARAAGADAVITSSRFSRDEIVRWTPIRPDRLHVVPLGVAEPSTVSQRPAALPDEPFALVVGANREHKGLETLADVWRGFGSTAPLRLVSAGPVDPARFALGPLAGASRVSALGRVSPAELEWLYGHATLLLFPSTYEGFGLPLMEAAIRGVPVLASDIPALRESGADAVRFVSTGDVAAWTQAISELAADDDRRRRMSAAGRERAAAFTHARTAAGVLAVLERVWWAKGGGRAA